ncbi:hypothetical protein ACIGFK_15620 [Streptomyces sp. NPDC085524]
MSPSSASERLHTHGTDAARRALRKVRTDARIMPAPLDAGAAR